MRNRSVFIRAIRGGLLFLVLGLSVAHGSSAKEESTGDLSIVRVYAGWRDAASFKRISEYFSGRENTGGETVLRTHPDQRSGYYFLVRVTNPGTPQAITARLEIITEATAEPVVHRFSPELKSGDTVFHLGLTGADWPGPKAVPVAWKLDLTGPDGRVLATEKSYLWERPAAR
jgi:hypothetical protein